MLSHVSASEWILSGFILACACWVLAAEFLPGKRSTEDEPPDAGEDPKPAVDVAPAAA